MTEPLEGVNAWLSGLVEGSPTSGKDNVDLVWADSLTVGGRPSSSVNSPEFSIEAVPSMAGAGEGKGLGLEVGCLREYLVLTGELPYIYEFVRSVRNAIAEGRAG